MTMQMLYIHWKAVRFGLVPFVIAAFGLPLLVAQGLANAGGLPPSTPVGSALSDTALWLPLFPMVAGGIGIVLSLSAWNWDHKNNHVYALALPLSRHRYSMLKFSAGALLALLPVAALLTGSMVAILAVDLPAGLQAYPIQLAGRFFAAILVVYAILFALASGTIRTAVIVLSLVAGVPFLTEIAVQSLGPSVPALAQIQVDYWVQQAIEYGPFRVLLGSWLLFDV